MPARTGEIATSFDDFGALLRFLRRRARLTQRELGLQVGYSEGHICRLEQNDRLPEPTAIAALFVPVLRPDPATAARLIGLARQSRDKDAASRPPVPEYRIPAPPPHAVDRPDALARVRDLLAAERVLVIRGLAGAGKTTLAAAAAREHVARGAALCWITLSKAVSTSPEALARQLARHLAGQGRPGLEPLLEQREDVPPLPLDHQLDLLASALTAPSGLIGRATSTAGSTLVCLDNAQVLRGEEATLATLMHLAAISPVALLLTSREPLALAGAAAFRLDGLRPAEALQLVANIDPGLPPALADRLLARTAGYPMLLRLALGQTCQPGVDRTALVEHLSTNPEITAYLLETTLDRLGPDAERLVSLLAVCRTPVDLHDETLVEESHAADGPYDLLAGLDELRRRQLVDDPAAATLHPLVRDQIHARLVGQLARRRRLHRAAAIWYEHVCDDVLEAAWHFGRAGEYGRSAEVLADRVHTLIGGGQSLPAADLVIDMLPAVRRRPDSDPELVRRLLVLRGDLLVDTTRAEEAESAYREALALSAPPAVRAAVARRLAVSLLQRSQVREALTLSVDAAAPLGAGDTLLRAGLAVTEAQARLQLSEHDEALRVAERALALETELAAITPESAAEVATSAHSVIGVVLRLRGQNEQAAEHLRTAVAAAHRAGLHHRAGRCLFNLGAIHIEQGDFAAARAVMDQAANRMRATGDSFGLARVLHSVAVIDVLCGEPATALRLYDEACALKERVGDAQGLANSRHGRALALRALGRVDEALTAFEQVLASPAGRGEPWSRTNYLDGYATTLLVAGRIDEAPGLLREALDLARNTGGLYAQVTEYHLALALLAAGEPGLAERLAAADLPERKDLPEAQVEARLIRAAVALYRRDVPAVLTAAEELARWVDAVGYLSHRDTPGRLVAAAAAPPVPAELPRLLWLPGTDRP